MPLPIDHSTIRSFIRRAFVGFSLLSTVASAATVDVYRDPNCGCCSKWITYLKENGYEVNDHLESNMHALKQAQGVPDQMVSCHTGIIAGKFIEGHVPVEQIALLQERKDLRGVAAPGMPVGSPGMERGGIRNAYQILGVTRSGDVEVVADYQGQ